MDYKWEQPHRPFNKTVVMLAVIFSRVHKTQTGGTGDLTTDWIIGRKPALTVEINYKNSMGAAS